MRAELGLRGPFTLHYVPFVSLRGRFRGSYLAIATTIARANGGLVYTRNVRQALMAARLGLRVVVETHQTFASARWLGAARLLARHPRLVRWIFISRKLQDLIGEVVDLPMDRCLVAHSGVDIDRFTPVLERNEARRRVGLPTDRTLIVHSGHMYEGRGIELLIEAASELPNTELVLLGGTASDVVRIRSRAGDSVRVIGHRPLGEVPTWLFASDVLVMPYTSATTTSDGRTRSIEWASPMKLFEYLAAGRAIVSTRFPGLAEVLVDGHNARLVEPDRPEALRSALLELVADSARRSELGTRAREATPAFSWRERARRVLDGL